MIAESLMHHSFDGGRTWIKGRPDRAVESGHRGSIRYHIGDGSTPMPAPRDDLLHVA